MYTERDSTGRMKLLFEAWHGDLGERRNRKKDRKKTDRKKEGR